jgi:hypothetical protein
MASHAFALLLLSTTAAVATVYDFAADGQEYVGDILGRNPLFFPGGIRSLPEFNRLYSTSNGLIVDEFLAGAANPFDFRVANGYYGNWENGSPVVPTWVNSRPNFKFLAGSALGGEYSGFGAGDIVKFRAYSYRIGSGHFGEMAALPFIAETSAVAEFNGQTLTFRFDSLPEDARSFAAYRTTAEGEFQISGSAMNTSSVELTTVADDNPPPFRHAPTTFDFANEAMTYPLNEYLIDDSGPEGLAKVNAAHASNHGFHDEEFIIDHPPDATFRVGGGRSNSYEGRYLSFGGNAGKLNWWVNAKEGHMFPQDAAIGVTRYNPNFTAADNNGNPVEVIIRAYAERIETGAFTELAGLTVVGEARGLGFGTFNTPPVLELMANARSFTVHTGDGNGHFVSNLKSSGYAGTALNQIIVDTVPEAPIVLPGDYNGDDKVDAADYTIWRDTFNSTNDLRADGDASGTVDAGDYDVWKSHFGEMAGGGANVFGNSGNVPEPGVVAMVVAVAIASTHRKGYRGSLRKRGI